MIGYLIGEVVDIYDNEVIIDVNDIGYQVIMNNNDILELANQSQRVKIYTYMQVRDDDLSLFGFLKKTDLKIFNKFLEVNGIGPKMAINILGKSNIDDLIEALENGDISFLTKCPGVGKKTAQRMILELKGKLVIDTDKNTSDIIVNENIEDALEGLSNLGFSKQDVKKKFKNIKNIESMDTQEIIKQFLRMTNK